MGGHVAPNSCAGGGTENADTACQQFALPPTSTSENMQRRPNILALLAEAPSSLAAPPGSSARSGSARRAASYEESEEGSDEGSEAATFGNLKVRGPTRCRSPLLRALIHDKTVHMLSGTQHAFVLLVEGKAAGALVHRAHCMEAT